MDNATNFIFMVSVHRNSILTDAVIYLLQKHSTCFGCTSHPSSGIHKTVTLFHPYKECQLWKFTNT